MTEKPDDTLSSKLNYIGKTNDIHQELQRVANEYGNKYKPLIKRDIVQITDMIKVNDAENKSCNDNNHKISFTLMQFNILADGLSSTYEPSNKMFKNHSREYLPFNYRGFRLIEEIIRFKPDLITAQEVDQIEFVNHYLSPFGYKYIHCIKPKSPCISIGQKLNKQLPPDGSAVFWNSNVFEEIKCFKFGKHVDKNAPKDIRNIVVAAVHLKHKTNGNKQLIVASTHLKAHLRLNSELMRIKQLMYILPNLRKLCGDKKDIPLFIGTDFNSVPLDMMNPFENTAFFPYAYQSVVNGKYLMDKLKEVINKEKNIESDHKEYDALNVGQGCIEKFDFKYDETKKIVGLLDGLGYEYEYGLNLKSAYCYGSYKGKELGNNPRFTCTLGGLLCLDFILFQPHKNIDVTHLLSTPEMPQNNGTLITPRGDYPSDHFSLMATFKL